MQVFLRLSVNQFDCVCLRILIVDFHPIFFGDVEVLHISSPHFLRVFPCRWLSAERSQPRAEKRGCRSSPSNTSTRYDPGVLACVGGLYAMAAAHRFAV